jgi:hypothetical protein
MNDDATVDLGGCGGCGIGCAVACDRDAGNAGEEARRVLAATGVGILLLATVPGVVVGGLGLAAAGAVAGVGALVALLAVLALRRGRPAGDGAARLAFRLVPAGMALLLALWGLMLVRALVPGPPG